jgi:hypothetical protein
VHGFDAPAIAKPFFSAKSFGTASAETDRSLYGLFMIATALFHSKYHSRLDQFGNPLPNVVKILPGATNFGIPTRNVPEIS